MKLDSADQAQTLDDRQAAVSQKGGDFYAGYEERRLI
jgi:hypothetical protein